MYRFNLSQYEIVIDKTGSICSEPMFPKSKVIEAIKSLKEERLNCYECGCGLPDEKIEEIFGKELSQSSSKEKVE